MPRGFFLLLSGFVMVCSQVRCVWGSWRLLIWFFPPAAFKTEVLHLKIPGMIGIKKDPLARKMRIRLSVLPGLKQCHHGLPRVVLTFTFSPTDVTALRNSSICRGAREWARESPEGGGVRAPELRALREPQTRSPRAGPQRSFGSSPGVCRTRAGGSGDSPVSPGFRSPQPSGWVRRSPGPVH
ncbi:uncharacterized protein LOC125099001 isoform X2 [Lutra lutra]|uniref:uncharacterized protein LOC125099001 isoform X2 n=1 Tax=Lutra lutra TaxID=9657 RepID=UPI001FD41364|nr:uncharacterized protein LOC125099001 isoform X2 [Lutra lutra]